MIKLGDTIILAAAKLRAHKLRTVAAVFVASLLFGVLVAASLVATGALKSIESLRKDGLTSRYIVNVYPNAGADTLVKLRRDPQLVAEAKVRYEALVEKKIAEAKRLGVPYAQASDQPPYTQASDGKGDLLAMRDKNGIVFDLMQEYFKDKPVVDDIVLEKTARQYGAVGTFSSAYRQIAQGSTLDVLPGGKEIFYDQVDDAERNAHYVRPAITPLSMTLAPPEISNPFLLPRSADWQPDGTSIPIILPQNAVEQLLKKSTPPETTSAAKKLAHLRQLREDAAHLTVQACYRNSASNARIQQAVQQQKEIKAGEASDDYQKPAVIYALPDPAKCEGAYVASDTRTDKEKTHDEKQALFDKEFSDAADPVSYFVTFKIVGISPPETVTDPSKMEAQSGSLGDVIDDLLKTNGVGQIVPKSLYEQLDATWKEKYADLFTFTPTYFMGNEDDKQRFVEFASITDAQKFINEQGCTVTVEGICKPIERRYHLSLAFTNSAALDDIRGRVEQWFRYGMLAVVVLAAVIMWITVGRAISDGRHEAAIFRAIGFKRGDIAGIYLLYAGVLSVCTAVCAGVIGWLGAYVADRQFASQLTAQAQYGFGGLDMTKSVSLLGVDLQQQLFILVACLLAGLVGAVAPLLFNVRRNPMRDMREE